MKCCVYVTHNEVLLHTVHICGFQCSTDLWTSCGIKQLVDLHFANSFSPITVSALAAIYSALPNR